MSTSRGCSDDRPHDVEWTTACPDWERRILAGESLVPIPPLFPDESAAAIGVFNELRLVDVRGCPTMGEACRPWFTDFVAAIFGAYDREAGCRLITEFFLLISKKNGKSTGAAGIMLTALIRNWRESAEFLILAPTTEVADNAFKPARDMISKDPELVDLLHVQDYYRTITNRKTGAALKVVAADSDSVGGKKATGVLVDELWLFGKQARADNMLLEATGGLASRPEGFVIYLSTQSNESPAGVFLEKLDYARGVRDGRIDDPQFLPVIYEFPAPLLADERYLKPKNFYVTNPNLGASVSVDFLEREARKAHAAKDPKVALAGFCAKYLNVEVDGAIRWNRWVGADFWSERTSPDGVRHKHGDRTLTLDELIRRSEVIVFGADGGGLDDLFGLCAAGREHRSGRWLLWHHAWAHKIVLERRPEIAPKLREFADAGELTIVDEPGQDVTEVADKICLVRDAGLLPLEKALGVDAVGIGDVVNELLTPERGFKMEQIIGIAQGWKLTGAIKTTERKLAGGEILHGDTKLMKWSVSNARSEQRGNAVTITKQISGLAKIDPVMATFNAVTLLAMNPVGAPRQASIDDWLKSAA